jgi:tRNA threonylcarbamoyladenosine biosynthesis protein TsaB
MQNNFIFCLILKNLPARNLYFCNNNKLYMYILNLETSTKNCSVALSKNGIVIAERDLAAEGYSHAELLHVYIQEVLAQAKIKTSDLVAVAVGQGPGSYTGLRIGVSAAKGLCFAADIPLIFISSLQNLASQIEIKNGFVIPMIDARRMEVYSTIFDEKLNIFRKTEAQILDQNSFENIDNQIYIVGDCQEKVKIVLTDSKFIFHENIKYPTATAMSKISHQKFQTKEFEDLAYCEPLYLKDFLVLEKIKK